MSESHSEPGAKPAQAPVKKNAAFAVEYALLARDLEAAQQHADRLPGLLGAIAQTEVNVLRKRNADRHTAALNSALPGLAAHIAALGTKPQSASDIVTLVRNAGASIDREVADYLLGMALSALVTHNKANEAQRLAYGDDIDVPIDTARGVRWSCSAATALLAANKPKRAITAIAPLPDAFPDAMSVLMEVRGRIHRQQGNKFAAALDFLRAIEADPHYGPPLWGLVFIIWDDIAVQESLEVVERVVQRGSHHFKLNSILADLYSMTGQVARATPLYRLATRTQTEKSKPHTAKFDWPDRTVSKPDFLIIGAPKCGTTSAYDYMTGHPKVLKAATKEITFFNDDKRYSLGTDWYLSQFPTLAGSSGFISGEATPGYFHSETARARITKDFPDSKLILFLRDPTARAISSYYQQVKMGKPLPPISEFFKKHLDRHAAIAPEVIMKSILGEGVYHLFTAPWLAAYSKESLLIIKTEEFFENPANVMRDIFHHVGLEPVNRSNYPVLNKGLYPQAPESLVRDLNAFFRPHNEIFYNLTGKDFGW